jgi:glutathione S-transferase
VGVEYKTVKEARPMQGVRLVLSAGFPAPWGQAAKKMLEFKKIPYVPVAQIVGDSNDDLVAWTGSRNAPALVYNDTPAITRWMDLIRFVDDHVPEPALLPRDSFSRVLVMGIVSEIAGEWGFGWCRRLMLLDDMARAKTAAGEDVPQGNKTMMNQYGHGDATVAAAPDRVADILRMLTAQLQTQRKKGSEFLVGSSMTAADIYWACFSSMLEPLPDKISPMSAEMRAARTVRHPTLLAVKDPILLEHRDQMFFKYLGPVSF